MQQIISETRVRRFDGAVERLRALLDELLSAPRHRVADHPAARDVPGIYLFSEKETPVYVGQTRKLRTRLRQHTKLTAKQNQASFAFNIAKNDAEKAGIDVRRFRNLLEEDPEFISHFDDAKTKVAGMEVQFIELDDPIERTLFEVYAALALETEEFNKFETH